MFWIYLIGVVLFVIPVSRFTITTMDDGDEPDAEVMVMSIFIGLILAWAWPIILVGAMIYPFVKPRSKLK